MVDVALPLRDSRWVYVYMSLCKMTENGGRWLSNTSSKLARQNVSNEACAIHGSFFAIPKQRFDETAFCFQKMFESIFEVIRVCYVMHSSSLLQCLSRRECGMVPRGAHMFATRQFYQYIVPNEVQMDVSVPSTHFRRFTDDGKHLIAISRNQHELQVYSFQIPMFSYQGDGESLNGTTQMQFQHFFSLKYARPLTREPEVLCKDFCLLSSGDQFMIVASTTRSESLPDATTMAASSDPLISLPTVERVTLYLLLVETGELCDQFTFENEHIILPFQHGVSIYNDLLAILSLRHQTITLLHIKAPGQLVLVSRIGANCHDDDAFVLSQVPTSDEDIEMQDDANHSSPQLPRPPPLSGLTHRLLTYLYKQAVGSSAALRRFFFLFDQYASLVMWKMQFLDFRHLLIKFGSLEGLLNRQSDSSQNCFLAVYNFHTTEIVALYHNGSQELLQAYELLFDMFLVRPFFPPVCMDSSFFNNIHTRESMRRQKATFVTSKNCSFSQVVRRALSHLPFSPYPCTRSPYLDDSMFSYDEKILTALERPKACAEYPTKFLSRKKGAVAFKIIPGIRSSHTSRTRKFATCLFHPILPFVMVVQHTVQPQTVNIHYRWPAT
eukprot:GILJ01013174.1.p1 GENE.GILJ01013174.1~~GILJ01013174.1.p1  ORF type:complete len:610 (-),score=71.11 GILJ01013174.1:86-1915(-)